MEGRRWRKRRFAAWGLIAVLGAVVLVLVGILFLTRAHSGQRIVLEQVLKRLQGAVNGRIVVEDLRSDNLFDGVTLYGVEIVGADSRPLFQADTVRATYGWPTFISGNVVLSSLAVYGPDLRITRYPGEEEFNVDRVLRTGEETDTIQGATREVVFHDVRLVDATVEVLYPAPDAPGESRYVRVPSPVGDGELRRLRFEDIDAVIPRSIIASADVEGPEVTVEALSLVGQIYEEPFRIDDMEGDVTWADGILTVQAESVRLPDTRAGGTIVADFSGDEGLVLSADLETPHANLGDLQWLEPRIPDGTARGGLGLVLDQDAMHWTFSGMEADVGESYVEASGDVTLRDGGMSFEGLDLRLAPLDVDRLAPWVEAEIPVEGEVRGRMNLDGTMEELRARGELTLREPGTGGPPTTADFRGTFHLEDGFGVTDLRATLDPLDWDLVEKVAPGLRLGGSGRAEINATGSLAGGLRFEARATHTRPDAPSSRVIAEGSLREVGDDFVVDVHADVSPLSLTALKRGYPEFPLTGEISGAIRAVGPLSDLRVTTDLETEAGVLAVEARLDVRDPGSAYSVEGDVADFRLSRLIPELPDPTVLTGRIDVQGRGTDPATLVASARLRVHDSRVGGLMIDTARAAFTVEGGVLRVDTLDGLAGGISIQGEGTLALEEGGPAGEVHVAFRSDSLGPLRPIFLGDSVLVRDDLTSLEEALLVAEGLDPDTLPTAEEVALEGRAQGDVWLRGSLERFSAEGTAAFEGVRYGRHVVRGATVDFSATDLPSLGGEIHAEIEADSLDVFDRSFAAATLEVDYTQPEGRFDLLLRRTDDEDYRARARFEIDTLESRVALEEMTLRFDSLRWSLEDRAEIGWNDQGLRVDGLVLTRPESGSMRIAVDGFLPREGEGDFTVELTDVRIDRLARILQREDLETGGVVDLTMNVTGTAAAPIIQGTLSADSLVYRDWTLDRLAGDVAYRNQEITVDLDAWRGDRIVLTVDGTVPADLALTEVADRLPDDRQIDLTVVADSLAAAFALAIVPDLEDVEGTVSADFRIQGTIADPEPTGTLVLQDAAWTIEAIGVRHGVRGSLTLNQDATVEVDAVVEAEGTATVTGTMVVEPLTNPTFDLEIVMNEFLGVDRRDVTGTVSGSVTLTGTYQYPIVRGRENAGQGLRVDRGVLFLEEFQRSATVVDLSDPRFLDVIAPDTLFTRNRPLIAESQNPFLNHLRVEVDLAVENDTWLRSQDMNVEIGGDLIVTYDRGTRNLVLVGELEALRGSYGVLGRQFEVETGQVDFVGTAGIDPNLNIRASTQIRQSEGRFEITATVTGTLTDPQVRLSSDEQAIAESDLVSYLIFGRPSYALASQESAVAGAAGSLLGATAEAGVSVLTGTLTSRLGSIFAPELGLDYFAINSQPTVLTGGSTLASTVAQTTVEVGRYLSDDLFAILVLRPLTNLGGASGNIFAGARLEWRTTDLYRVEVFIEDQFLRSRALGFQENGFEPQLVYGFLVVREWGY